MPYANTITSLSIWGMSRMHAGGVEVEAFAYRVQFWYVVCTKSKTVVSVVRV
jgi:hypothetical protein